MENPSTISSKNESAAPGSASFLQVVRAISLGILGVRSRTNYKDDLAKISVKQAFLGGFIALLLFMTLVIILVTLAVKYLS